MELQTQNSSLATHPSILSHLNELATKTTSHIKFDDLEIGVPYKVEKFGIFEGSRYGGNRVSVYLKDGFVILPERFDTLLENDEYVKYNKLNFSIVYEGRDKSNGNRLNIKFV